jgi:hypothetical protein
MSSGVDLQRFVVQADQVIGRRLEGMLGTRRATDLLLRGFRLQGSLQRVVEKPARVVLHTLNMPTRGDVAQLRRALANTNEQLSEMSRRLEESETGGGDGR